VTKGTVHALAAALMLAAGVFGAAVCKPAAVGPAARPFRLGGLELVALRDADNVLDNDGRVFGTGVGPAAVAEVLQHAGAPTDKITLGVDALLVKAPGRIMLFDTGLGPGVRGALMGSLAKAGVSPGDVTDVFITHSHGDHVGGLVGADGGLAFPRAVVHMSAIEWASMKGDPANQALVALIMPRVHPFEPGETVAPGIVALALYGHTPGHVGYEITSGSERLLDIGDTAHSSIVSLAKPDWAIGYDSDPALGRTVRRETLARLAKSHEQVFAPHFPFPGLGTVQVAGEGFSWSPVGP
jgi:glyoxylase-like metal-dependent hydrolase (beta-lactamase superfamily II)